MSAAATMEQIEAQTRRADLEPPVDDTVDRSKCWVIELRVFAPGSEEVAYAGKVFDGWPQLSDVTLAMVEEATEMMYELVGSLGLGADVARRV